MPKRHLDLTLQSLIFTIKKHTAIISKLNNQGRVLDRHPCDAQAHLLIRLDEINVPLN